MHMVKARTHRPIFRGFAAELAEESADSIPESADSTTDFVVVGRLPVLRIDNSGWSVKSTASINEAWTGCSQRTYYMLHILR